MECIPEDTLWEISTFLEPYELLNVSLTSKSVYHLLHSLRIPSRFIYKFEKDIKFIEDKHINDIIKSFITHEDPIFKKYIIDNTNDIVFLTNNITLIHALYENFDDYTYGYTIAYHRYRNVYYEGDIDYEYDYTALYYDIDMLLEMSNVNIINTILFILKVIEDNNIDYIVNNIQYIKKNILLSIIIIELSIINGKWYYDTVTLHQYLTEQLLLDISNEYHFIVKYLLGVATECDIDISQYQTSVGKDISYGYYIHTNEYKYYLDQTLDYDINIEDINAFCIYIMNDVQMDYASMLYIPKSLGLRFHDIICKMSLALKRYLN